MSIQTTIQSILREVRNLDRKASPIPRSIWFAPLMLTSLTLSTGCAGMLESLGAGAAYRGSDLADKHIVRDIRYREDPEAHPEKHRLDLFLPPHAEDPFPTLVFVHGGGWTHGDRQTGFAGIRPYQNIGRYWANQGVAVAVISYRLQPTVDWHAQVDDVSDATRWVRENIEAYGGRADALYLSGHSAGAWLAARLAFDATAQSRAQLQPTDLCGVILVSGAAFDVRDPKTYELGSSPAYFEKRFSDLEPEWKTRASIIPLITEKQTASATMTSPTHIFWAEGEPATFERQATLLARALETADRPVRTQRIPGLNHQKIIISMSRAETALTRSMQKLLQEGSCPAKPIAHSNPRS